MGRFHKNVHRNLGRMVAASREDPDIEAAAKARVIARMKASGLDPALTSPRVFAFNVAAEVEAMKREGR